MSYPLSDEDSTDSESGIRFKTESTRNRSNNISFKTDEFSSGKRKSIEDRNYSSRRSSDSSRTDRRHHRDRSKNRRDRYKRSRSRSRDRRRSRSNKSDRPLDKRASSSEVSKREKDHVKKYESEYIKNKQSLESKNVNNSIKHKREDEIKQSKIGDNSELSCGTLIKPKMEISDIKIEKNIEIKEPFLPIKSEISDKYTQISENSEESEDIDSYGPTLPPKLTDKSKTILNCENDNNISRLDTLIKVEKKTEVTDKLLEDPGLFGPALPPHLQKKQSVTSNNDTEERIIGPSIPSHLREKLQNADNSDLILPHQSDSDDEMIGPIPEGHISSNISHKLLEERALELKINSLTPADAQQTVREEWMIELPGVHIPNLGLGPRQFRSKIGPDMSDRSSWTDTPQDKEKKKVSKEPVKVDIKEQSKMELIAKRDIEQAEMVSKHKKKKKRDKALIDLHREKLKKKDESSSKSTERRPFDRDIDLKTNRFDDAQKKAILKKAQLLDTRFSCGESKFL